jgi:aspartate kinase
VDGVYTVDPNLYPEARKIEVLSYHEMLEMASHGTKVLQEQSVDYAMRENVVIRVASSFLDNGGTIISRNAPVNRFCGLTVTLNLASLKVHHAPGYKVNDVIALLRKNFIRAEVFQNYDDHKNCIMMDKKKTITALNILKNSELVLEAKVDVLRRRFSLIGIVGTLISPEICEGLSAMMRNHGLEILGSHCCGCFGGFIIPADQLPSAITLLHRHCGL